jgi:hypothetical protein
MEYPNLGLLADAVATGRKLYRNGAFEDAAQYICPALKQIWEDILYENDVKDVSPSNFAKLFQLAGDIYGELNLQEDALRFYQVHQFLKMQLKHDFQGKQEITVYQFRSNESKYAYTNLLNREVTLTNPKLFNDIVDTPVFAWLDSSCGRNSQFKGHLQSYKESFNWYRAMCFCSDGKSRKAVENTLMWAHYANCHKGFCIEYRLGKNDFRTDNKLNLSASRMFKMTYEDPYKKPLDFSNPETTLSSRTAFAYKSKDWEYENEIRIVSYNPLVEKDCVQYKLRTPQPVKAVYFGYKCKDDTIKRVQDILKDADVRYFKMQFDEKNIHRLIFKDI